MTQRILGTISALAAGLWLGSHAAFAENRIALVIGNSAYRTVTALPNPANDANAMAELLRSAGFEVVAAPDLTLGDMRSTISNFASKVAAKGQDTVALVFYAGHGIQIDGENYLVPIDVNFQREADVSLQALRLNDLLNTLASVPSKMRIIMLDACRNNPFTEISKTAGRGLAIVDAPAGSSGSLVSYSTSPGAEAEDGRGADSPYTTALLTVAREPGVPIEQAFKRVRLSVNQATNGRQTPWESSSLTGDFYFFPLQGGVARPSQASADPSQPGFGGQPSYGQVFLPRPRPRTVDFWRTELQPHSPLEAYEIVIRNDAVESYEAFLALFGSSPYGAQVRGLFDRRSEMVSWFVAVTLNTAAAYQAFHTSYPKSDLARTARRLQERIANRSLAAGLNPLGNAAASLPRPATLPTTPVATTSAPTCPCPSAPTDRPNFVPQPTQPFQPFQPPRRTDRPPDIDVVVIPLGPQGGDFPGGHRPPYRPGSDLPGHTTTEPTGKGQKDGHPPFVPGDHIKTGPATTGPNLSGRGPIAATNPNLNALSNQNKPRFNPALVRDPHFNLNSSSQGPR